MKLTVISALLLASTPASARPVVNPGGVVNAANYRPGIAQGSVFLVFGSGMGPDALAQANQLPLATSLGGTSVTISYPGGSQPVPLAYVSGKQIAAILPSTTPVGQARLTVTYLGSSSDAANFDVVRTSFALFTADASGSGPIVAQNFNSAADQPRNANSQPAVAGQTVTLWGAGLGPITGNDAAVPAPANLNANVQVLVGGVAAHVMYAGRSGCCAGVDQVVIQIPSGVEGCRTPIEVRVPGAVFLQVASISIAANRSACPAGGSSTEFVPPQFRFDYPAGFTRTFYGTDPQDSKFTLVRLAPTDGSPQKLEIRYATHRPAELGWWDQSSALTETFGRTQVGGIFLDTQYPAESSDAGVVKTNVLTNNLSNKNLNVIGTGIWARTDFAHIAYAYDRSRVSTAARDMVFRTLTFATVPSLIGHWTMQGLEYFFDANGGVEALFGDGYDSLGRYSVAGDLLMLSYNFHGAAVNKNCSYTVTLAMLRLDCGAGGVMTLESAPDF